MRIEGNKHSKERLELRQDIADKISHTMQRFNQRLTLANPRFVERYLSGELHLLVYLTGRRDEQYIAHFERLSTGGPPTEASGARSDFRWQHAHAVEVRKGIDAHKCHASSDQQTVLVDNVKFIETPENVITSLVRFGKPDSVLRGLAHQLYFSARMGFVFLGSLINRKRNVSIRLVTGGNHKLVSEMVKRRAQVEEDLARNEGECARNCLGLSDHIMDCSALRIALGVEEVWVGFNEGCHGELQVADVLIGPFNLQPDWSESVHGGESITP